MKNLYIYMRKKLELNIKINFKIKISDVSLEKCNLIVLLKLKK